MLQRLQELTGKSTIRVVGCRFCAEVGKTRTCRAAAAGRFRPSNVAAYRRVESSQRTGNGSHLNVLGNLGEANCQPAIELLRVTKPTPTQQEQQHKSPTTTMMAPMTHSCSPFGTAMPWQSPCNKDTIRPRRASGRGLGRNKRTSCLVEGAAAEPLKRRNSRRNVQRSVHFAVDSTSSEEPVQVQVHSFVKSEDKTMLWWSREELVEIGQRDRQLAEEHRPVATEGLQDLWDDSARSAARRGSCGRRRSMDVTIGGEDNSNSILSLDCHGDDDTLRGLEASFILRSICGSRRAMRHGIVNAQKECYQTHPTMKVRILSRTASHLSRASVEFAHKMALEDAKAVAQQ
ncbi:expressed unknown protein [Seminavis robusta]|uniref:Uncharacterized protein n=1 Tax=Seminavis robusta TaxID=568900 RepID=A0A9N8DQ81_9STRA|nr:expressed unknown protein [Seminavis robusta]|eukprot:Sro206_g086700.1 n/a (346) ;mRNA; r:80211-81248